MATISIPAATHINVVATTFDHSAKSNLGEIRTGSYLSQASMLVYDDILRYQRGVEYTHGLTAEKVDAFNYNQFEGNILWFMDELVGMESDWIKTASNDETTAYGYVQFTKDSVDTAIERYKGHIDRFNERKDIRDWQPYTIPLGTKLEYPTWLITLEYNRKGFRDYDHKTSLDALTYDEMLALAFVHLHSKKSKDANFVLLAEGDIYASKEIYKNNHHTNPDAATLARLEGFFPWRKQNKYVEKLAHATSAVPKESWMHKHCPGELNQQKTAEDVINCIHSKLILHNGDDLFNDYKNAEVAMSYENSIVTDVTSSVTNLGVYTNFHADLTTGRALHPANSTYKAFVRQYTDNTTTPPTLMYSYYFYRTGNITGEWLNGIRAELITNAINYNYDELCQTIESWPQSLHTYIMDWWYTDTPNVNYITPTVPYTHGITLGFSWKINAVQPGGILVLSTSWQDARGQLRTMFHEGGGHGMHGSWGGKPGELLNTTQNQKLLNLYVNYEALKWTEYNNLGLSGGQAVDWLNKTWLYEPMVNITSLSGYKEYAVEDEFLARIYSMMATNKCITFTDDIWPVMKVNSPSLVNDNIIDINMARKIDMVMRDEMKLDKRTYNLSPGLSL